MITSCSTFKLPQITWFMVGTRYSSCSTRPVAAAA